MTRFAPLLCLVLACWSSSAPAPEYKPVPVPDAPVEGGPKAKVVIHDPFVLEILGIEVIGAVSTVKTKWAHQLTDQLRAATHDYEAIKLAPRQPVGALVMPSCASVDPNCMAAFATSIGADRIVYGRLDNGGVTIHLLVAKTKRVTTWTSPSFSFWSEDTIRAGARAAMASLLGRSP
jgi:hypothetical protein